MRLFGCTTNCLTQAMTLKTSSMSTFECRTIMVKASIKAAVSVNSLVEKTWSFIRRRIRWTFACGKLGQIEAIDFMALFLNPGSKVLL